MNLPDGDVSINVGDGKYWVLRDGYLSQNSTLTLLDVPSYLIETVTIVRYDVSQFTYSIENESGINIIDLPPYQQWSVKLISQENNFLIVEAGQLP